MKEISVGDLKKVFDNSGQSCAFIDVRTDEEWNAGHIKGFMHIPLDHLPHKLSELNQYKEIYFLCRSGKRSQTACDIVDRFQNNIQTYNIVGGILSWNAEGYSIVTK